LRGKRRFILKSNRPHQFWGSSTPRHIRHLSPSFTLFPNPALPGLPALRGLTLTQVQQPLREGKKKYKERKTEEGKVRGANTFFWSPLPSTIRALCPNKSATKTFNFQKY
jgi:hypothetical protein